ncbi:hypothetical protein [Phage f2b1]|nr:hypothetical protein [Phage f2b1]
MGIIALAGGIGLMCAAGSGVVAAFKFFHTWEPDFSSMGKRSGGMGKMPKHSSSERMSDLRRNLPRD